jgi:hypothetical protein
MVALRRSLSLLALVRKMKGENAERWSFDIIDGFSVAQMSGPLTTKGF